MVVETYGALGKEATAIISSIVSRLSTSMLAKVHGTQ